VPSLAPSPATAIRPLPLLLIPLYEIAYAFPLKIAQIRHDSGLRQLLQERNSLFSRYIGETGSRVEVSFEQLLNVYLSVLLCIRSYRFWNGSFRPKLPFVFSEMDGTICEGFANGNGSCSKVLAVSKGCGGRSIFITPFET